MKSIKRRHVPSTTAALVTRILERPGLTAAVRQLPGAVLGKLIERVGLEDAGDLVALASTAQLAQIFDDDLWRAQRPGGDETFQPERFALWLRVMRESGEDMLTRRLLELPQDLVALAFHRLVLVIDMDVLGEQLSDAGEDAPPIERALESAEFEEWEEFRLIARQPEAWDDAWTALMSLDRDHHQRLRDILEQCCAMTTEYISGQGGLFQVLTADEMLDSDVAAAREDRRSAEGFVSPADARAFLALAARGDGAEVPGARDPITRAYFRNMAGPDSQHSIASESAAATPDVGTDLARNDGGGELAALLREHEIIAPPTANLLTAAEDEAAEPPPPGIAPLFEAAMSALRQRDTELFSQRAQELGYLMNVWMAAGEHEGRRPRPPEALEAVLGVCESAMRARLASDGATMERAVALLSTTPADVLFRQGYPKRPST